MFDNKKFVQTKSGCVIFDKIKVDTSDQPGGSIFFQIFHLDVPKLSSRKNLSAVDNDARRPIFCSSFDDTSIMLNWFTKNMHLFLAARVFYQDEGKLHQCMMADSQFRLHAFEAWMAFVLKIPVAPWCAAQVKMIGTQACVQMDVGEWSEQDFNDILDHKKKPEDCVRVPLDVDPNSASVIKTDVSEITEETLQQLQKTLFQQDILKYGKMGGEA